MALTRIDGTVEKELGTSGYAIQETIKTDAGATWQVRWAVWTKTPLNIGDFVQVDGELGVKVREYIDAHGMPKHTADRNINNATIKVLKRAADNASEPF